MFIRDGLTVDKTWETQDGFLGFSARFAKTGIQHYLGDEIDPEGKHLTADGKRKFELGKLYPVNRPSREVFSDRAMGSFIAKPITNDHPSEGVNVNNWKDLTKGVIGEVLRDGQYARMSGLITDKSTITDYRAGKKELSGGYATQLVVGDGVNEFGESFVAEQTAIDGNHCALVQRGRAGPACAISDSIALCDANPAALADFSTPPSGDTTMKIKIGDAEVDATNGEAVRIAVDALNKKLTDAQTALTAAKTDHDKAMAAKDAEIDDLKAKVVDQDKIDALADEKADAVTKAKALLGDKAPDFKGKTVADVRRETVRLVKGDAAVTDKSDDYIEARFDGLTDGKTAANDTVQSIGAPRTYATDNASVRDLARATQFA